VTASESPDTEAAAERALALAADAGIHRLSLSTPFLVGRVNCYLIDDDPLTLVDTGPNSGTSLDELERALSQHGRRVEDLGLIVLSHQHMDHVGLLEVVARRSGAEVAGFHLLGPYLRSYPASASADDEFGQAIMRRHGVPLDLVLALGSIGAAFRAFGSSGHVTIGLHDRETLTLRDRTFEVFHRPGHSPSDTIFWDPERRILLAGDHVLAHISSNPLVSRPLDAEPDGDPAAEAAQRPHALLRYLDSMRATRELPAELVLSGHGDPITDHAALIDERFRMHRRRARKIHRMLERGPASAYEIALQMWGNVAISQPFLTLSEVLGHVDLLTDDGRVRPAEHDGVVRFEAVAAQG
jgi:glyoxylase-like metal-dependent hydrolase (beta-lactamase superfamily II)